MTRTKVGPDERRRRRSQAASAAVDTTLAKVVLDAQRRPKLPGSLVEVAGASPVRRGDRHGYLTQPHD